MPSLPEAIKWIKSERERLGWSTTELASKAREIAALHGDNIKLKQQSISGFENGRAKTLPRWYRYAEIAMAAQKQPPGKRQKYIEELLPWADFTDETTPLLEGPMKPRTPEEYQQLDALFEQLDAVMVPEVQVGLSMGGGSVIEDWPVVQMVPMSRSWLRGLTTSAPDQLMVARGDGDSMMPTILDQDLVIIDRAQNTPRQQDRIWALTYGGWGMIKRLRALPDGSLQINSDNTAVSPIVAFDGEAVIIGRVVGVVRRI